MNMHHKKLIGSISFFICGVFLLAACGGEKLTVRTEHKNVAFDLYKTYRWYDKSGFDNKGTVSEITYDYIKQAIDKELKIKQMTKSSDVAVDFYVNVTVTAKARVDIENYQVYTEVGQGYSYSRDAGFHAARSTVTHTKTTEFRAGTLIVDVIDPFSNKLVWRGIAEKRLPKTQEASQRKRESLIDEVISAVLADFPPNEK